MAIDVIKLQSKFHVDNVIITMFFNLICKIESVFSPTYVHSKKASESMCISSPCLTLSWGGKTTHPCVFFTVTKNSRRPKAGAFATFNIIQFYTFCANFGSVPPLEQKLQKFCQSQLEISYIFPYYTAKKQNIHNFRLNDANDFIFGHKHCINKRNIF